MGGFDYMHMQNIWIADSAADFAAAVVYLLADRPLRERMSQAALDHVQKYAWLVIEQRLQPAFDERQTIGSVHV